MIIMYGDVFLKQDRLFSLRSKLRLSYFHISKEEQIMAHHDFFIALYNIDADPLVLQSQATMKRV